MPEKWLQSGSAAPHHKRRTTSTPTFIGRERELTAVVQLLSDPNCQLLTLSGVGGIGKTQLANEVLKRLQSQFTDGVFRVDLQPIQSGIYLVPAIADSVGAILSGRDQLQEQLYRYLEPKHLMLVLDNFEHLLDHVTLLPELLQHAPNIKLLVTSREALNLQEEWLYPLNGLTIPDSHQTVGLEDYDAIRLFVERARQVRPNFSLADERAGVIRVCQLVEGMPLAIEMAAAWTKSLRCAAIAAEIQRSLQFLTSRSRNVSERHHSIEAVFVQTWQQLTDDEQALFKQLTIFRGGFPFDAAQVVANASLPLLASLQDKSLIRRDDAGRFHLHELLRQYGESQLEPTEAHQVAIAHCLFYADFLDQRQYHLVQGEQARTAIEIETELENIRAAWQTAIQERRMDAIKKMACMLFQFGQVQARYLEIVGALNQAIPVIEEQKERALLAEILVPLAWMLIRLGKLDQALRFLQQSRALFEELALAAPYGMGTHPLAASIVLQVIRGRYAYAVQLGDQLTEESTRLGDQHTLAFACYGLASAYFNLGSYSKAYHCAQQAVKLTEAYGNRWFMAYCLNEWGQIAQTMGNHEEAEQHYQASYHIRREFRDPEGIAVALHHLGDLALLRQYYSQARGLYEESLSIYQNLNDQGGLATAHQGLGEVATLTGQIDLAIEHLSQALTIATHIQFIPRMLTTLIDIGTLMLQSDNQVDLGIQLLNVILHHPISNQQQRKKAEQLLGNRQLADLSQLADLNDLIPHVQIALKELSGFNPARAQQPLVEPLTDREVEILQLLSRGMSNAEIGEKLFISIGTVKAHTSRIYDKLSVRNRTEATAKGRELHILIDG